MSELITSDNEKKDKSESISNFRVKPQLTIREAKKEDAKDLLKIYRPYVEHTAISFEYEVPSEEEFASRIENTLRQYPYLVAQMQGQIVGYAYAGPLKTRAAYDKSVELSVYVSKDHRQLGIGRSLYDALENVLKDRGFLNLYACIAYPKQEDAYLTKDSVHFHEKMGYEKIAHFHQCGYKFGHWYDMIWMEKLIGPHLEEDQKR